uniref:DnaJ (Hsp40) homolog, subfamily C, member 9 n=1 Tax=Paramormyrops kingsleyae TaxID=1676925 RepID=A0A3B3REY4_9TELE
MGLLEQCEKLFKTSNLYEVLGVVKEASDAEVRRAYYKVSLQVHPDRAPDDRRATEKFQVRVCVRVAARRHGVCAPVPSKAFPFLAIFSWRLRTGAVGPFRLQALGKVYAVLSDKEQRAVYDEQGILDEESVSVDQDRNWEEYWRLLFPKITVEDILNFEKKYKGTEEEQHDVCRLYVQFEGDMDQIMGSALCCTHEDEPRIATIIQGAIDAGDVPTFRTFTHESDKKKKSRKRRADKEQKEAEEMQKEMGVNSEDSLVAMLKQRQKSREQGFDSFLSDLEAKYSKKGGKASAGKKGKK